MPRMERYLGLMSGTSADGVDAVVARFESGRFIDIEATHHQPYPTALREQLIALGADAEAAVHLPRIAALDVALADMYADAALQAMGKASLSPAEIRAIGCHGQTVFHAPQELRSSLQWGDPSRVSALTGIPVVADFRRMDVALGGQGAPLVPAFHAAVFGEAEPTAVLNLGGIANITVLPGQSGGMVTGYDCGPANALMDAWAQQHLGTTCDTDGAFAARGQVTPALLSAWLAEPYFSAPPPKSTGRALFNLSWAEHLAPGGLAAYAPQDVQASFCELTARAAVAALPRNSRRLLVCGGGAFNQYLMRRLAALAGNIPVQTTEAFGLPPQWVEAAAFAWLAHQRVHNVPGNLPSVTGASRSAVLGGVYGERVAA